MKIAVPLMLAWYFQKFEGRIGWLDYTLAAVLIVVPVYLIKRQPDLGTALLIGASGFSYEEAAAICECAVGTIKSRVNRARNRLAELMSIEGLDDFGPDQETRAVLTADN